MQGEIRRGCVKHERSYQEREKWQQTLLVVLGTVCYKLKCNWNGEAVTREESFTCWVSAFQTATMQPTTALQVSISLAVHIA